MTQLIAQSPVFYRGRTRRKGEVFDASDAHAKLLLKTRQVRIYEDPAAAPLVVDDNASKPRRQYRRRDMRAES